MTPTLVGGADGADVGGEAGLSGLGQVVRQEQDAVGAGRLELAGEVDRHGGAVAAAREDRHVPGRRLGRLDRGHDLGGAEREELAGAAGGEEPGGGELRQPGDMLGVGPGREAVLGVEGGDGEGEKAGADLRLEILRVHAGVSCCEPRAYRTRNYDYPIEDNGINEDRSPGGPGGRGSAPFALRQAAKSSSVFGLVAG